MKLAKRSIPKGCGRWTPPFFLTSGAAALVLVSAVVAAPAPPAATLGASTPAQGGFGTIKGRLVWGGTTVPQPKILQQQGKADKNPEVCAKNAPILSQELVVDPQTKGIRDACAYLIQPKGANPQAVQA